MTKPEKFSEKKKTEIVFYLLSNKNPVCKKTSLLDVLFDLLAYSKLKESIRQKRQKGLKIAVSR